jgi:hypothetical protein
MSDSLGDSILLRWIIAHVTIPDGDLKGQPYWPYSWQAEFLREHYRVKPTAIRTEKGPAFVYRRSQLVSPQKSGKSPFAAVVVCCEALGPVLFDGFAQQGDIYECEDNGCSCGWTYTYKAGDPKGKPWSTPLIQLIATSEEQVANSYRPLQIMLKAWPDDSLITVGEQFIRLPNDGRIEAVTSSATARLGNPVTFASLDETHLYLLSNKLRRVAETVRRGVAGMSGRSIEITNAWTPSEQSVAQMTAESGLADIYSQHVQAAATLSYTNKQERRKIHRAVYAGSDHVDLNSIEAEAAELIQTDPAQAERFFGTRIVQGHGTWLPDNLWQSSEEGYSDED